MKILVWFFGLLASLAAFLLTVLEILKNHLGVDTKELLYSFGDGVGRFTNNAQLDWGKFLSSIPFFDLPIVLTAFAIFLGLLTALMLIILSSRTLTRELIRGMLGSLKRR